MINPIAEEILCNGLDDDCSDATPDGPDADGDGVTACSDCDDQNANVHPGVTEVPRNEVDDDCNPGTRDGDDLDGDGHTQCTIKTEMRRAIPVQKRLRRRNRPGLRRRGR